MPGFHYVLAIIFIFALGAATAMKDGFFSSFKIVGKAAAPAGK